MRQVRLYQRKDRPGWYVSWREDGKERKRSFPNKKLAEHFQKVKYTEINSGVFRSIMDIPWKNLVAEYMRTYDVRRLKEGSKYEGQLTLRHFEVLAGPVSSKNISQGIIDNFIINRAEAQGKGAKPISNWTINKDISNLRAFIRWGQKHRFLSLELEVNKVKTEQRMVTSLSDQQISNLLIAARARSECWYIRVLLALTTGLRSSDLDRISVSDIDFENSTIRTRSRKTGKYMTARPLHPLTIPKLTAFVAELPAGQIRIFAGDTNTWKKWDNIRRQAKLPSLRFHDLRSVFSTALQSRDVPLSVVQTLLEHSSPSLTQRTYTNTDPLLAPAIERLPVGDWIQ